MSVLDRGPRDSFPLAGSFTDRGIRTEEGMIYHPQSENEVAERFPGLLPVFRSGLRSVMIVPLVSKGETVAALQLMAIQPNAYTQGNLRLALKVGTQIAGAIANVQLMSARQQAEEALRASEEPPTMPSSILTAAGRSFYGTRQPKKSLVFRPTRWSGRRLP